MLLSVAPSHLIPLQVVSLKNVGFYKLKSFDCYTLNTSCNIGTITIIVVVSLSVVSTLRRIFGNDVVKGHI